MNKARAAAGSAVFLVIAPGLVAGFFPWWMTSWRPGASRPIWALIVGTALASMGIAALLWAFVQFVIDGQGTPAPVAAPDLLVIRGLYRFVRNPMYLAVLAVIVGQMFVLDRPVLLGYAAGIAAACAAFVQWYEQPALTRRFGDQYRSYQQEVPAWWPRLRPARDEGSER